MPDLSSGRLFWKRRGFDGVRPITFIFQTWLWTKKRGLAQSADAVYLIWIDRCVLQLGEMF